ncbi:hypothetical protein E2986_12615 [Frieseomelitta varia]|uniref:CLASP N-terminal domain-containing protein n=1 Tax=Frieseomelitta varia TaxID=561572 RepID=A0A833S675_9HYME|nr:hypothetical protein E2986_12615 [Frieseomelitta varia]
MEKGCMSPQQLLDRLRPAFNHKNAKLREEALILLTTTLNEHGADEMILSGVIPSIVKLLSDPSEKVRETALNTLADIYRHVGERLRVDLQRKHNVPQAKLLLLIEKFDQLKAAGDLLPLAMSSDGDLFVPFSTNAGKRLNDCKLNGTTLISHLVLHLGPGQFVRAFAISLTHMESETATRKTLRNRLFFQTVSVKV